MKVRNFIVSIACFSTAIALSPTANSFVVWGLILIGVLSFPIVLSGLNSLRENQGLKSFTKLHQIAFGVGGMALFIAIYNIAGTSFSNFELKSLAEAKAMAIHDRHSIVESYVNEIGINAEDSHLIYNCFSHLLNTKSVELTVGKVLGWCKNDYSDNNEKLAAYLNFDEFEKNLSGWDGAYRPLEKQIKAGMHDKDSYEHVETKFRFVLDQKPRVHLVTTFTGKNTYGATVQQRAFINADIESGAIDLSTLSYSDI
ncbi:hypothetical protein [Vibrio hepatarius]|uniref:hypothetical protein n=1 Tax=Vibrio hepatarius TaxID=171383 RepID=UPI001C0A152E|nr:hypothetical protein [Vibrio hepatarius]MBU2897711.1 hypothetical protein [Vibrio hepatarius]